MKLIIMSLLAAIPIVISLPQQATDILLSESEDETEWAPVWARFLIIFVLVCLGGLVAGLTIGLMSLDETNLKILKNSGSSDERRFAQKIEPLRQKGHLLLCTLLITNTVINETLPIVTDSIYGGGWQAILISSALIVVFGEIIPQAICTRYGLKVGANLAWFVKSLIFLLYIIAYPISLLLDWMLGEHHGTLYRRTELKELVSLLGQDTVGNLTSDEVTIIKGVLDLRDKHADTVMTPIEDVFSIDYNSSITADIAERIVQEGYSRIPVFKDKIQNIVGMILVKKLIVLDLDQEIAIKHLPLNSLPKVSRSKPLFDMINEFQSGQSHMAVVVEPSNNLAVGIITLEDVIEEMIQEEIIDETDQYIDIHARIKVSRGHENSPYGDESTPLLIGKSTAHPKTPSPTRSSAARHNKHQSPTFISEAVSESEEFNLDIPPESPIRLAPEGFGKRRSNNFLGANFSEQSHSAPLPFKKGIFRTLDTKPVTFEALKRKSSFHHSPE